MINYFFNFLFFIFSIFVLLKSVFYALYEIKSQDNKSGGVAVIVFSVIVIVFNKENKTFTFFSKKKKKAKINKEEIKRESAISLTLSLIVCFKCLGIFFHFVCNN